MPGSYDGKVVISTELDNSKIRGGVKEISGTLGGLKNVVGKLGAAIATAFSVRAIIRFGTESVKATNELSNALTGLKSILDGQGKSFSDAQAFIEEYTKDGLVPATNAITAYKNLAMRGYDDSQIRQVMVALKDASAFGRQASYTMGEAVQSATEGLKNENSILVDNAGVTKNVAKMWEEYAERIGTTADKLTQQQKIQAEVNGILEESKYQAGDAAKVADTLSGQLTQLSFNFQQLKVAVGSAINPIVKAFLPAMNQAVVDLTIFAEKIASVVNALMGNTSSADGVAGALADGYDSAADSVENLANATEEAAKAAKKALAPFDEITKISIESEAATPPDISPATPGNSDISIGGNVQDNISPVLQSIAQKFQEWIAPLQEIDFSASINAVKRLGTAFVNLGKTIAKAIERAWFTVLTPFTEWVVEDAAPVVADVLSSAFDAVDVALQPMLKGLDYLWASLEGVVSFIGETVVVQLQELKIAFSKVAQLFSEKSPEIERIFSGIGDTVSAFWNVVEPIFTKWRTAWNAINQIKFDAILEQTGYLIDSLAGLTDFLAGVFTGDWERAWTGLQDAAKAPINGIIGYLNGMIKAVVYGVNALIEAVNTISFELPDWDILGNLAGEKFGLNIPMVKTPQIPYLAQGAVLPANKPFMAVVGDQRHGTNVEAPLSTIQEAVALVMEDQFAGMMRGFEETVTILREILEAVYGIQIGDEVIAQAVSRYNRKMNTARGGA